MGFIHVITSFTTGIDASIQLLVNRTTASAVSIQGWIAAHLLPTVRREVHAIALAGTVMVAAVAVFTTLILREIDRTARTSSQEHAEQLLKTVTYQLETTLLAVEHAIRRTSEEIVEYGPQKLVDLVAEGQIPRQPLRDFFFLDLSGRVVASAISEDEARLEHDLSDREYFRPQLENPNAETRIGRPLRGARTGIELIPMSHPVRGPNGDLIGVLVAMIDISALERIWVDIGFKPDDTIELIGADNIRGLRSSKTPRDDGASGDSMALSRPISGWPIRVVVTLARATIDRDGLAAKRIVLASAAAGSLMIILCCLLLANRARQITRERDIAGQARESAERERDAAEAMRVRLVAAIDAVPVEFLEYDREGRLILANRAARKSQRYLGDPIGRTQRELLEEGSRQFRLEDPDRDWKGWVDKRIEDIERGGTFEFTRPNNEAGRFFVNKMPGGGRVVVRVDITEAKRREQQLAAEMERLNSVVQSTGAGMLMLDRDARVVLANQFLLDLQNRTAAEVVGRPYSELAVSGLDPAVIENWQAATGSQRLKPFVFENNVVGADGAKRLFRVTANPVQDEAGRLSYIVLIGVDETERRLAEIRLFDSSRLANLGDMASGMAHEINQPLAVIRMAADSLIEELEAPEAASISAELAKFAREKLSRISSQTERAADLVRDLRAMVRRPTNDPLPFDVAEAARVGGNLLHEQLKAARIEFTVDLPPPGLMVRGEASRLQQVIIKLALNARDALLEDPSRSSTGTLGHVALRVAATPAGDAMLTIEDDGPGIPAHVLPRLFEPFFTAKPTGKGTGLGLSISYDIVKRMGGEITAENRPEGGARFRIVLPPLHESSPEMQSAA